MPRLGREKPKLYRVSIFRMASCNPSCGGVAGAVNSCQVRGVMPNSLSARSQTPVNAGNGARLADPICRRDLNAAQLRIADVGGILQAKRIDGAAYQGSGPDSGQDHPSGNSLRCHNSIRRW